MARGKRFVGTRRMWPGIRAYFGLDSPVTVVNVNGKEQTAEIHNLTQPLSVQQRDLIKMICEASDEKLAQMMLFVEGS